MTRKIIPVILESPFKGDDWSKTERNIEYARLCMRDCLMRGEAPYASHLLYTQHNVLDDKNPEERKLGITAGFAWRYFAKKTVVYTDFGISSGVEQGVEDSIEKGIPVEYRKLPQELLKLVLLLFP